MESRLAKFAKENGSLIVGLIAAAVLISLIGILALREHDARLVADTKVELLQSQRKDNAAETKAAVAVIQKRRAEVKTPVQAVKAIPEVSTVDLGLQLIPEKPEAVEVQALPLYRELSACREDAVNLAGCRKDVGLADEEIKALKKKPGFWHRVGTAAKWALILGGTGYAAGRLQR